MRILVTGGAGFIGSHIADRYIELGHEVLVVDDLSTGKIENLNPKLENRLAIYDISYPMYMGRSLESIFNEFKPEVVSHHAARCQIRESKDKLISYLSTNIIGTARIVDLSVRYGVKKFIFASSGGAVYGDPNPRSTSNKIDDRYRLSEASSCFPIDVYGLSKFHCEQYLSRLFSGGSLIILRYSNVYGPRQRSDGEAGAVAKFVDDVLSGNQSKIYGDGSKVRDFVYIDDIVDSNVIALESDIGSYTINVGTGIGTSVLSLFNKIFSIQHPLALPAPGIHYETFENRQEEVNYNVLDISYAMSLLKWIPAANLNTGLKKTIEYEKKRRQEAVKV